MIVKYGCTRKAEIYDTYVIKRAINDKGIKANQQEYERYKENPKYYAKCELLEDGSLKMECLEDCTDDIRNYVNGCYNYCQMDIDKNWQPCNRICKDCIKAIPINIPEYIDDFLLYKPKDCIQCGYDKEGNLKYYDYADN